jgi:antitoxin YefM
MEADAVSMFLLCSKMQPLSRLAVGTGGDGERQHLALGYANAYIRNMRTASYSDLRKNLAAMLDSVNADRDPVIITRDRGKPAAVLMSLDDFASYEETRHLLKSPANANRLTAAIEALDKDEGTERPLAE